MAGWRKELSLPGLLSLVSDRFQHIPDPMTREKKIALKDCLLSGLAIFNLKFPSLLQFDDAKNEPQTQSNLKSLFGIQQIPSDTYLRERLDVVAPNAIRPVFKALFAKLQRGKALEQFTYLDNHYLLSVDGTGYFSSHQVHCPQCCEKHHHSGEITYYHQLLGAALVHPDHSHVLPFAPEPISKQDGARKNDCERNAAKRLLRELRREHPHLKLIVVEDALASNGPHIALLRDLEMRFILGAKPKDHTFLFDWVANSSTQLHEQFEEDGTIHRFQFINGVPLNDANFDCEVNFLAYWEIGPGGKKKHFSWVTDIPLTEDNVYAVMRGGRARWRIENETFNTLKNQGYHFEHNFGHGHQHLSTVFAHLMLLAFLIDQIQGLCCQLFKQAVTAAKSRLRFWEKVRGLFFHYQVHHWEDIYLSIIHGPKAVVLAPDTS